jgi:cation:H+ antiporter
LIGALPLLSSGAPVWLNGLAFVAATVAVWIAGTRLTHALDAIARKTGLGEAFVGMLLLGGITSLPEVANVVAASSGGAPQLAVNNLLGSAAINVVLLALVDAVVGRDALTSVVAKPATLMMAALCMLVLAFVAAAVLVGDTAMAGVGVWSVSICVFSIFAFGLSAGYGRRAPWTVKDHEGPPASPDETPKTELRRLIVTAAVCAAVIFAAGYALSEIGETLADQTGLGDGLVGFLLIGTATSMPELSSIRAALGLRRYEMAFGQVLGTNFVNLSLILLADAVFAGGPVFNALGAFEAVLALLGLILIGVFQVGLLERRNSVLLRAGYDSLVVMVLFVGGAVLLFGMR